MPTLLDTMAQRVEAQVAAIRGKAQAEADEIVAAARERADAEYAEGLKRAKATIEAQDKRAHELAQAEADKLVLSAQHAVAADVLASVSQKLRDAAQAGDFGSHVEALLAEAVHASKGDIVVIAPQAYVDTCMAWLATNGRGDVPVEVTSEFNDGIAVQNPQRTYRLTNTLSSRYAKFEETARKMVMAKLFGGGA